MTINDTEEHDKNDYNNCIMMTSMKFLIIDYEAIKWVARCHELTLIFNELSLKLNFRLQFRRADMSDDDVSK